MNSKAPYWLRRLTTKLREAGPVKRADMKIDHIKVTYVTNLKKTYTYNTRKRHLWASPITKDDSKCDWPIQLSHEHEWNPLDTNERSRLSKYFHISRSKIDKLSYIERELLIQHIISIILGSGYIRPYHSESSISNDLAVMASMDTSSHGISDVHKHKYKLGRTIIETYCDIDRTHRGRYRTLDSAFYSKKILFSTMQRIVHGARCDLNVSTIHNMLYRSGFGPEWYSPVTYKIIINELFNINQNTVLVDSRPNIYEKAIAAGLTGCAYAAIDGSSPPQGMIDRIGIRVVKPTKPYDILIADNRFKRLDIDIMVELINVSRNSLVYIKADQARDVIKRLKPSRAVKLKKYSIYNGMRAPDYLFQYGSAKIR